jgi:hypothetical protein
MSIVVMRQALEVLEMLARYENPETRIQVRKPKDGGPIVTMYPHKVASDAATALRAAIEQAEKPMAWFHADNYKTRFTTDPSEDMIGKYWQPLYTAPRQWVELTDDEARALVNRATFGDRTNWQALVYMIDAKLKEKNAA